MHSVKTDYMRLASGQYLTDWFPDDHDDLTDEEILEFIEEHPVSLYEYLAPLDVLNLIVDLADMMEDIAEDAIRSELAKGQIHRKKTVTHGNPDREVGGLVTVDYVDVTFKAEDWNELTS